MEGGSFKSFLLLKEPLAVFLQFQYEYCMIQNCNNTAGTSQVALSKRPDFSKSLVLKKRYP